MNDRKKLQKKKERERQVRKDLLLRRETARKQRKEDDFQRRMDIAMRPRQEPIRNNPALVPDREKPMTKEEVKKRLEHNLKILKALEEEYDRELSERQQRNEDMEADGIKNFDEKVKAIADYTKPKGKQYRFKGEANCRVLAPEENSGLQADVSFSEKS
jgi:hypothetical protein